MRNGLCISIILTRFCIRYDIFQGMISIGDRCSFVAGIWLELLFDLWFQFIFGGNTVRNLYPNVLPGIISFALSLPILYRNLSVEDTLW